jgi:enoyl-CoA hydratase/carnithine racemase
VHNAFDEGTIAELTAAFERLATAGDVRCVVLRGSGRAVPRRAWPI